ncbi:MAG: LamG-like jellyroll fold domain-containing protein, partial [Verrucomicrobiota bacterium]
MKTIICLALGILGFTLPTVASVSVVDYWHLGENDPGAAANSAMTNSLDSVGGRTWTLTNSGALTYSANVSTNAGAATGSYVALRFTNSAYATSAVIPGLRTNFGVELWVNPATATGSQSIFYNGDSGASGWGLYVSGNTFTGLFGGVSFIFGSVTFTPGTWNHVALVESDTVATLYVNGAVSGTLPRTPASPAGQITVGANHGGTENFSGLIDEIRVFTFASNQFSVDDLLLHQSPVFTISPTNLIEAPAGGMDNVSLAVSPTNVSWSAAANAPWLHLAATNGVGNATIPFSFDPNTNSGATPQSGALTIAGQTVSITQGCPIAITSANNATFPTSLSNSFTFIAVDVPAPTFTTSSPLPAGVSLSPAGVLSGVPPEGSGGIYPLAIVAGNGISPNATQNFTLNVIERSALVVNPVTFNTNGWGWTLNGSTVYDGYSIANNVFTPTDGSDSEATSAWYEYPLSVGSFLASFTYQSVFGYAADGVAFVLQTDTNGPAALGGNGGYLGYVGITPSVAVMLD